MVDGMSDLGLQYRYWYSIL